MEPKWRKGLGEDDTDLNPVKVYEIFSRKNASNAQKEADFGYLCIGISTAIGGPAAGALVAAFWGAWEALHGLLNKALGQAGPGHSHCIDDPGNIAKDENDKNWIHWWEGPPFGGNNINNANTENRIPDHFQNDFEEAYADFTLKVWEYQLNCRPINTWATTLGFIDLWNQMHDGPIVTYEEPQCLDPAGFDWRHQYGCKEMSVNPMLWSVEDWNFGVPDGPNFPFHIKVGPLKKIPPSKPELNGALSANAARYLRSLYSSKPSTSSTGQKIVYGAVGLTAVAAVSGAAYAYYTGQSFTGLLRALYGTAKKSIKL